MSIQLTDYNRRALYGGIIATLFTASGVFALGSISEYEARQLIKSSVPGFTMLCNTVVLASATILALLLTLLGISSGSKSKLKKNHYKQVLLIAKLDAILFIMAIAFFQFSNIPITEAENLPNSWYANIYWTTLAVSSLLSGGLVSIILMLYSTVRNIILIVGLDKEDHPLISKD